MLIYFHTRLSWIIRPAMTGLAVGAILILQFFGSANGQELVRHLDDLSDHYQEHMAADPNLSLQEFLSLHFGELQKQHHSEHDHSNLPFQDGHQHTLVVNGSFLALPQGLMSANGSALWIHRDGPGNDSSWIMSELTYEIWQPPRTV